MKLPREEEEQRQPGVPDSWQTLPPDTQEEEKAAWVGFTPPVTI